MPRFVDQSPDPRSHVKTLMRIGYTLNSAVSDIIDNSLTAKATMLKIYAPPGREDPLVSMLDDGIGMSHDELIANMRIGCKDPSIARKKGDLGRFGSGMKTASFSQARELTVISKAKHGEPIAARWDIDRIEDTNSWCLEIFEGDEVLELPDVRLSKDVESGTQVIWKKLTCLETGNHVRGQDEELATKLSELKAYIALHFHRFMSGKDKISISLNGDILVPIDPFLVGASGYQEGRSERLRCKGGHIFIKTHVLPHFNKITSRHLKELGGAEGITQGQGIYLYREKRLISAKGWHGLAPRSQLGALARVQVDIPSSLDNAWSTDVKKSSLQMPPKVKRELRKFLSDPIKRSKRTYSYRGTLEVANPFWRVCEDENTRALSYQINAENEYLESLVQNIDSSDRKLLVRYLKELAFHLPIHNIYEKMSARPKDVRQEEVSVKELDAILDKVFKT